MSLTDLGGLAVHDATSGIGYGTGAGGTVTQATSKATGVTLNAASGQITLNNSALTTTPVVGFTLTNSAIAATDTVIVSLASGAAATGVATSYVVGVGAVSAGACRIFVQNISGLSLSDALVLNFTVLKGSSA
jgi:hypothetical protein